MVSALNKKIAILLTAQTFFSPLAFAAEAAEEATETFAVKAASALEKNDFTGLENGSATFTYSDGSRAYVKVSDFTATTTAADGSTSTANLGKQYEICSVSKDSRAVSCNYTTVSTDGTKDVKSLDIDNTAEHQIYSVPTNATYTDEDKKYFVTSYDNPYYKFKSVDESGHISGTNCIKLNANKMVCSADSNIDMSKLTASDFQQDAENTEKYQVNKDVLTNAMLSNSDGSCSIEGWVQADSTHCCPPNDDTYSYNWDTAQQQCKVTKNGNSKSDKNNSLTKDLLGAAAILAGSSGGGKKDVAETAEEQKTIGWNVDRQNYNPQKLSTKDVIIKLIPEIPTLDEDVKAIIEIQNKEYKDSNLTVTTRLENNGGNSVVSKGQLGEEILLYPNSELKTGKYLSVVTIKDKNGVVVNTIQFSFEVVENILVLSEEERNKKQTVLAEIAQNKIDKFNITGDITNVSYDSDNQICSFYVENGTASLSNSETKPFRVDSAMPVETKVDSEEDCNKIKESSGKVLIEGGLLHYDNEGNAGVSLISEESKLYTSNDLDKIAQENSYYADAINEANIQIGDVSTIKTSDGNMVVEISTNNNGNQVIIANDEAYTAEEFTKEFLKEGESVVISSQKIGDTTINRAYVVNENEGNTSEQESKAFYQTAFDAVFNKQQDSIKKINNISRIATYTENSVELHKEHKDNSSKKIWNGIKEVISTTAAQVLIGLGQNKPVIDLNEGLDFSQIKNIFSK